MPQTPGSSSPQERAHAARCSLLSKDARAWPRAAKAQEETESFRPRCVEHPTFVLGRNANVLRGCDLERGLAGGGGGGAWWILCFVPGEAQVPELGLARSGCDVCLRVGVCPELGWPSVPDLMLVTSSYSAASCGSGWSRVAVWCFLWCIYF